ncbi:Precorrin-2 C(20)-methyltransferase [Propionicimonas sp. T2.31MG-18]|uniref:precorrin-2 C(20)-methyltransferase n=1 Tax=Propionicimonas sp. T2.31MG-18 TaxID=3157620 RepID=UPI0035E81658
MDTAARIPALVGVGVGPGDPELVTRKAVAAFDRADVILVPSTEASGDDAGRAEQVVLAACPEAAGKLRRVPFSMAQRTGVGAKRRQSWEASAQAAVDAFQAGAATVAFATVGDPSVYSTFSYLAAQVQAVVPDVDVSVVPGITAMQALAAASLTPLVEGRESLTLVPVTAGLAAVGAALEHADTVVAYKGGRQLADLLALVHDRGLDGVLGVNVGLPGQTITPLSEVEATSAPYFSTVLVAPRRTTTGGAL